MDDLSTTVQILWWATLVVAVIAVLPVVIYMLHRTLTAARHIEQHAARALEAGLGVAGNTANISALEDTISTATVILDKSQDIEGHTGTIGAVLAERVRRKSA